MCITFCSVLPASWKAVTVIDPLPSFAGLEISRQRLLSAHIPSLPPTITESEKIPYLSSCIPLDSVLMVRHQMFYAGWIIGHILKIFSAIDEVNRRAVEVSGEEERWLRHGRQQYGRPHIAVFGLHTVRHLCINHSFISVKIKLIYLFVIFQERCCVHRQRHI